MPKIIKSGIAIEEDSPVVINLPDVSLRDNTANKIIDNDLAYFKHIDQNSVLEDDSDYEKYYRNIFSAQEEDNDDLKYYKEFTSFMSEGDDDDYKKYYVPIYDDVEEEVPDEKEATEESSPSDDEKLLKSDDDLVDTEKYDDSVSEDEEQVNNRLREAHIIEQEQFILQNAHEEAEKLIEAAKAEAESLRMKLVAEVSEAEVKKELAKTNADTFLHEAKNEAETIIAAAKAEAEKIAEEARQQAFQQGEKEGIEKGTETGHKVGYDKGFSEGLVAGNSKGQNEGFQSVIKEMEGKVAEATQKAQHILVSAQEEKERLLSSSDQQIVEIVMAVATKVIHKELAENPFNILQIVKEAIKKVSDQPHIFVTVSAMNYDFVNMACEELKKSMGSKQEIVVVADNTLGPADVIVGTGGSGDVDARLETQMNEIRKTIEMVISQ